MSYIKTMNKLQKYSLLKKAAIELKATNPNLTVKEIAKQLGINKRTIIRWRTDPNFLDAIDKRYMVVLGGEIPAVTHAMIREAKSGNVQAARLLMEFSGKLIKKHEVNILSPWEKYFKKVDGVDVENAEDAELMDVIDALEVSNFKTLPERDTEHPVIRNKRENKQIDEALKNEQYSQQRKVWYQWNKRAKAVGVEPLSARRPTKGQRKTWEDEIIKRESDERKDS